MSAPLTSDPAEAACGVPVHAAPGAAFPAPAGALVPGPAHPVPWRALLGDVLLDADSWAALGSMTRLRRWKAGELAMHRGDAAVSMLALCEGRLVARAPLTGPAWLDLHTAWLEGRHEEDARVVSASALVMEWPMPVALLWLRTQPLVLEALVRAVSAGLGDARAAITALTTKDATGRVAAWLLAQAGGAAEVRLAERKRDVAARLSITPETLSRTLRQLADRDILTVQGYRIGLRDRVALLALARCR
ncbi:Crp/Fnr family transcriptional regulator [Mitsuaria sp. GD03876]|uniref:Crp/Fnr family transcriptional regulator n=1 Tax=Mitsuaria sp. GD03876 TaxID=2975399 RepID=UPI00244CFBB3|nr:Crp/Fnr family transcriptional regulator [Mitsuaria sp. GD03876]MDH0864574.1 Crp/Fnr family transcriptional regulator [Mitsuaria sp. GD03876]